MLVDSQTENDGESSTPVPGLREAAPPIELANSIQQDFRALVEILSSSPQGSDELDGELFNHLQRARDAAAQGLRLSERLVKMAKLANSAKTISG